MNDLSHLKETYTEYRKEMKRGYGCHSFETRVPKLRIAELSNMVDNMPSMSNNYLTPDIRDELTGIMCNSFTVVFKSSLKAALSCATPNQFIQMEAVIKRNMK